MRKRVLLKSPLRENCTAGSVRGTSGNWRSYRDKIICVLRNANGGLNKINAK